MPTCPRRNGFVRIVLLLASALLLVAACGVPALEGDPRLGEQGRVRFTGGGCTSSTTLAVGAEVTLRLESATEEPLPGGLDVTSGSPDVIGAEMGLDGTSIVLDARKQGVSRIEVLSEGEPLDALLFAALPAGLVKHTAESRVLAGGALDVVVGEVYADCGEDESCRLIGNGFLSWSIDPPDLGDFVIDYEGTATFRAKAAGDATVVGTEPTRQRDLVRQPLEIVAADQAESLSATLTTIPFDPDVEPATVALPGAVALPDAFSVRVDAVLADGSTVAISRRDVTWRIEGEELAVLASIADGAGPLGTPFLPAGKGTMTLVAEVPMLGLSQAFELELD